MRGKTIWPNVILLIQQEGWELKTVWGGFSSYHRLGSTWCLGL